jgi:DNA-binding IclR family transcriptional regulator
MEDELGRVRVSGIAYDREEAALGSCCVAAPVIVQGSTVAALSLSVPIGQFQPERLGPAVLTAARGLSRRLERSNEPHSLL